MQGIDHAIEEEEQQREHARARARIQRIQERSARTVDEHKLVMSHVADLYNKARADEMERLGDDEYEKYHDHALKAVVMAKVVPTLDSSKRMDMDVALKMIHDGSIEVRGYKPGEWEWTMAQLLHAPNCVVDALFRTFLSVAGPSSGDVDTDLSDDDLSDDDSWDDSEEDLSGGDPSGPPSEPEDSDDEPADEPADAIEAEFREGVRQDLQAILAESAAEIQAAVERNRVAVAEINANHNAQIAAANARLQEERERLANARAVAQHAVRDAAAHPVAHPVALPAAQPVAPPAAQVQPEPALAPGVEAALAEVPERQKRRKEAEDSRVLAEKLLEDGHIDEWQYTFLSNTAMEAFNDRVVHVHHEPEPNDDPRAPELIRAGVLMAHEEFAQRNREIGKSLKDMTEWANWVAACAHQETREQSVNLMTCIDKLQQWSARKMGDASADPDLARWKTKLAGKKRKADDYLDQYRERCHCGPNDMPKSRAMPGSNVILDRHRDYVREWAVEDRRNNLEPLSE